VSIEVKRARIGRAICSVALVVLAVIMSACGSGTTGTSSGGAQGDEGTPQRGGTLRFARYTDPVTLDPNTGNTDNPSIQTQIQIFDQLIELRPDSEKPQPGLAKSWSQSEDGLSWTFHLRDARFSNGRPVTSADVKFSLERVLDPKVGGWVASTFGTFIEGVSAPDRHTAVIHVKRPSLALPYWLTFNVPSIVSKVDFERMGAKKYATNPIGSGPFKVQSWQRGQQLTLVRNPYYWRKGLPYLDKVVVSTVPNENTRILQIQSGQVDLADDLPFSQMEALSSRPDLTLLARPIGTFFGVSFNLKQKPFDEVEVRQALNYALPKDQINDVVFQGRGQIANSVMPRMIYWSEAVKPYPYDIAKAREVLATSSVPNGFTLSMEIVGADEASKQAAQIIQQAWERIGVHVRVVQTDAGTAYGHVFQGDVSLLPPSVWSSDIPSQDEFAVNIASPVGEESFGFYDRTARRLVTTISSTKSERLRVRLYPQLQQALLDNPLFAPIVFIPVRAAFRKNVHGFDYTQTNWWALDSVWLSR